MTTAVLWSCSGGRAAVDRWAWSLRSRRAWRHVPAMQRDGMLRLLGAPHPVPLHHRAIHAQMTNGLFPSTDETWSSGQLPLARSVIVVEPTSEDRSAGVGSSRISVLEAVIVVEKTPKGAMLGGMVFF